MSQSSAIAFYLMVGFIIFVTMRKELPKYAAVIGLGRASTSPATATTSGA